MKFDPFLSDEPSIAPPTPGAVLVRLSQVLGALKTSEPHASSVPSMPEKLASARQNLMTAIENGENLSGPFTAAQNALRELYAQTVSQNENDEIRANLLLQLGFPDPRLAAAERVLPVDVSTVVATHFKPEKQVFSTLSFAESHGATAYWLFEVRYFKGERLVDGVVENYAPQFSRVRLPVGTHNLIIESRNPHYIARSEEFTLEVPQL
ncbi:MAG TPA: hypothetical protein VGB45_05425 [Abditibacterium sp.]|jgi:hypothetical protein